MVMESIKAALKIAKAVKNATDAINNADLKLQIADLISALADAKLEASKSIELIASLKQQLKLKSEMKFNGSVFYRDIDGENEGPYCPTCYDVERLVVHLHKEQGKGLSGEIIRNWLCKACKRTFK